jgi:hypothetical protein
MAKTAETLGRTGLISPPALSAAVVNDLVESGIYPGLEQAVEEDPIDWDAELEHAEAMKEKELEPTPAPVVAGKVKDAAPRTLYVKRKVLNAAAILKWAKAQGLPELMPGSELHVTIVYSKAEVDWFKIGESWSGELKIAAGGPRLVERFGNYVAILFASTELQWRHRQAVEAGASHDYDEYQPHVSIAWSESPIDLTDVEPYQGEIVLGPEIFEEVKDD